MSFLTTAGSVTAFSASSLALIAAQPTSTPELVTVDPLLIFVAMLGSIAACAGIAITDYMKHRP